MLCQANPRANQGDPQWESMGCCHLIMFLHFRKWDLEAPPVPNFSLRILKSCFSMANRTGFCLRLDKPIQELSGVKLWTANPSQGKFSKEG